MGEYDYLPLCPTGHWAISESPHRLGDNFHAVKEYLYILFHGIKEVVGDETATFEFEYGKRCKKD